MRISIDDNRPKKVQEPVKIIPFSELSFKQKLEHIWTYYKWHIMIPLFSIIAAVSIGFTVYENFKDSALYVVFLNSEFDDTTSEALMNDYIDYAEIDMKGKKTTLDCSMNIYRSNGKSDTASLASNQKLLAMYTSIEMDLIIGDMANFEYYAKQGSFVPLAEVLPAETLKRYADRLVSATDSDNASLIYGIDISDSKKLAEVNAYVDVDPVILSIPTTHMEDENLLKFIDFLLED